MSISAKRIHRALLSMIRKNAEHPCPRCLIKKIDTIKMGTQLDMRNHYANIRVDDHIRQITVKNARRLVFEQGTPLNSVHLKAVLGKYSGIPMLVCSNTWCVS